MTISNDETESSPQASEPEATADSPAVQIWVGSLSDYNNGILHGVWLNANAEPEALATAVWAMLRSSPWTERTGEPAEEWAIMDTDGFDGLSIDEHESLEVVSAIGKGVATHGEAYAAYAHYVDNDADSMAQFEEVYEGEWDSLTAYVESYLEEAGYQDEIDRLIPESFRRYVRFDVKGLAHDLHLSGELYIAETGHGGVWIFRA